MEVKTTVLMLLVFGVSAPAMAAGFQSLGDLARQEKLRRDQEAPRPVREFTNDNLPPPAPWDAVSTAGAMPLPTAKQPEAVEPGKEHGPTAEAKQKDEGKKQSKEYWESRFKAAQQKLLRAEELLHLSEDELSLLRVQQAREIGVETQREVGNKIATKLLEIESDRAEVLRARQEMDALEEEFAESGAPEDWLPTKVQSSGE